MTSPNMTSQVEPTQEPLVHSIFEPVTSTWQYIVADVASKHAVIIDPVLDYDPCTSTVTTKAAEALLNLVNEHDYHITHILETHAHADHLTASRYLKDSLSAHPAICIGSLITQVQNTFGAMYNIPSEQLTSAFDHTFSDGDTFSIGNLKARILHLPGHTPDHIGYIIGSNVFTGDSIFNPDVGSARCDFPGGSASALYSSIRKLLELPAHFRLYTGHDYPPNGTREVRAWVTVEEQRLHNKHVRQDTSEDEFQSWRETRDKELGEPRLLHQALQVNVRGGRFPPPQDGGLDRNVLMVPVKGLNKVTGLAVL